MTLYEHLDIISNYEKYQTTISANEFQNTIKEVPIYLTGSYKARFSKLVFIEIDDENPLDDIPF